MDVDLFVRLILAMSYRLPQCKNIRNNWSSWPQEKKVCFTKCLGFIVPGFAMVYIFLVYVSGL